MKPPFTLEGATAKVRRAEDAWNGRDPQKVSLAYTADSLWRNRHEFLTGRTAVVEFLTRKWSRNEAGQWFRSYGSENSETKHTVECAMPELEVSPPVPGFPHDPTHPTFPVRLDRVAQRLAPPETLEYIYGLLGGC